MCGLLESCSCWSPRGEQQDSDLANREMNEAPAMTEGDDQLTKTWRPSELRSPAPLPAGWLIDRNGPEAVSWGSAGDRLLQS
jgi:hypothetical protein